MSDHEEDPAATMAAHGQLVASLIATERALADAQKAFGSQPTSDAFEREMARLEQYLVLVRRVASGRHSDIDGTGRV